MLAKAFDQSLLCFRLSKCCSGVVIPCMSEHTRDKASAAMFASPSMCSMLKLNCWMYSRHLVTIAF